MSLQLVIDIISLIFILSGALFCLAASIGLARFTTTLQRMHASSKPQTFGLVLTMVGTALYVVTHAAPGPTSYGDIGLLVLITIFALMTAPVIGNRVGHVAMKEDREEPEPTIGTTAAEYSDVVEARVAEGSEEPTDEPTDKPTEEK